MADSVTIVLGDFTQKEWIEVQPQDYAPSNVLTIGQDSSGNVLDIPPKWPLAPQPQPDIAMGWFPVDACTGPCEILLHDSVSGWFFDSGIGFNDCSGGITPADVANIASVQVPCGPAWAGVGGLPWCPVFDYWIVGCSFGFSVPLVPGSLPPKGPVACATGHPPPCAVGEGLNAQSCCVPPLDPPLPTLFKLGPPRTIVPTASAVGKLAVDGTGNLPTVPRMLTPLSLPIPTKGIAVTACNCDGEDDEELLLSEVM